MRVIIVSPVSVFIPYNACMDFNSPIFLFLFLPVFVLIYHFTERRAKPIVGIIGSLLFYAWGHLIYIPLMLGLVIFSYWAARLIRRWRAQSWSLYVLWAGVLVTVALLVGFKLWASVKYPLGLSYVTFQVLAYLFEVYSNKVEDEKDLIRFSFYLLLFPKIPVGPITRYSQLRDQIHNLRVQPQDVADGLRRFIVGLAKKALIADTLARVVTPIFGLSAPTISPAVAWLVIISYSLQLYFDFSGYTDMALGLGRMMGLRFVENFNHPYLSKSIGEFWRRWHISLSSWFRDFVFYPLERHRLRWIGQPVNIMIVFLLTGLWHGLALNFVIWGLIHGLALVFESTFPGRIVRTLWTPLQHAYALIIIMVGWVFFRSPNPHFALIFLRRLVGDARGVTLLPFELTSPLPFIEPTFILALLAGVLLALPVSQWVQGVLGRIPDNKFMARTTIQVFSDLALIFILIMAIAATTSSTFAPGIYGAF
jgi:alginate O-acetyltransferase complex protein AlgI